MAQKMQSLLFVASCGKICAVIIMNKKLRGSACLMLATVIWGSAFVAQSVGMDHVGPYTFQAIRCAMACLGLLPAIYLFDRYKTDDKTFISRFCDWKLWMGGLLCGIPLCVAANLQQVGIVYTDAGKAAFLTAMYIIFVPIIGIFRKQRPSPMIPVAVALAVFGLYFLSCAGVDTVALGDICLLLCAFAFAIQITVIDHYASTVDSLRLNCIQAGVCAVGSALIMLFTESPTISGIIGSLWPMCYAGFLSMGAAYSLQIIGQKDLDPAPASLIMSLESVFAVLFGWIFLHETMTVWESIGCLLVFIAVIIAQLPVPVKTKH